MYSYALCELNRNEKEENKLVLIPLIETLFVCTTDVVDETDSICNVCQKNI